MTRWQLLLRRLIAALGPTGIAGLAAVVAAVALFVTAVPQREAEIARLQQEVQASAARGPLMGGDPAQGATPEQQLLAFAEFFPPASTLQDWIERIHVAGAAAGVNVERSDYRVAQESAAGLSRYHITVPVKGTYAQIRGLVAGLLEAVPSLALADMDLKRDGISAGVIDARLNLTLFLRGGDR